MSHAEPWSRGGSPPLVGRGLRRLRQRQACRRVAAGSECAEYRNFFAGHSMGELTPSSALEGFANCVIKGEPGHSVASVRHPAFVDAEKDRHPIHRCGGCARRPDSPRDPLIDRLRQFGPAALPRDRRVPLPKNSDTQRERHLQPRSVDALARERPSLRARVTECTTHRAKGYEAIRRKPVAWPVVRAYLPAAPVRNLPGRAPGVHPSKTPRSGAVP
jgi:hypothetical protein